MKVERLRGHRILSLLLAAAWPALQGCAATPPPARSHLAPAGLSATSVALRRVLVLPVDLLVTTRPAPLRWGERLPDWLQQGALDWAEATLSDDLRRAGYQPVRMDPARLPALAEPMARLADQLGERLALSPAGAPLDVTLSPEAHEAARTLAEAAGAEGILLSRGWLHVEPDATTRKAVIGIGITLAIAAAVALVVLVAAGSRGGGGLGRGLGSGLGRGLGRGLGSVGRGAGQAVARGGARVGSGLGRAVAGPLRVGSGVRRVVVRPLLRPLARVVSTADARSNQLSSATYEPARDPARDPGPPLVPALPLVPWLFPLACAACIEVVPEPPARVDGSRAGLGVTLVDARQGRVIWHASHSLAVRTPRRRAPRLWPHLLSTLPRSTGSAGPRAPTRPHSAR